MSIQFKNSLLMVDIDRQVRRLEITQITPKGRIVLLHCPLTSCACTVNCVAISLYEHDSRLGLACKAFPKPILLGVFDPETIDLDLVEALRHANTLTENTAGRKS